MSKEYNSALQARVEQFLKNKGISQAKAAPMMGISQTALSQYPVSYTHLTLPTIYSV